MADDFADQDDIYSEIALMGGSSDDVPGFSELFEGDAPPAAPVKRKPLDLVSDKRGPQPDAPQRKPLDLVSDKRGAPSQPDALQRKPLDLASDKPAGQPEEEIFNDNDEEVFEGFPPIAKRFEDTPHRIFDDPDYYKTALSGEGDKHKRMHSIIQKLLTAKDPKDKGVFRQQFIPAFWDFLSSVARKAPSNDIPDAKKFLLRYGMLRPTMLKDETRELFAKIIVEKTIDQPIYYLDEWFRAVGLGEIQCSTTDEAKIPKTNVSAKLRQMLEKAQSKVEGAKNFIKARNDDKTKQEKLLSDRVQKILERFPEKGLPQYSACYTSSQKFLFTEVQNILKDLLKVDHELDGLYREYNEAEDELKTVNHRMKTEGGTVEVDTGSINTEFGAVRQMVKMTIGRKGNHFPILTGEYFRSMPNDIGTRENVISALTWVESIDPGAFHRIHKNRTNRIVPYITIIPSYGDFGVCWEPFNRNNRATSRGRIVIPMYPKSLQLAVLYAIGDLRWQVAKEKASFYWMEEGLTGYFYQWFQKLKLKGDIKECFIRAYILWMTKESEGTMKLDKELRGTFWRYLPFSQAIKEKLKTRSFTYQELYQRDVNRSMSDGY